MLLATEEPLLWLKTWSDILLNYVQPNHFKDGFDFTMKLAAWSLTLANDKMLPLKAAAIMK